MRDYFRFAMLSVSGLILAAGTLSADWLQFRGPRGGRIEGVNPPTEWNDSTRIRWRHEIGYGSSSPIIVGDKLFVTCYRNYAQGTPDNGARDALTGHTVCIDRNTGAMVWEMSIPAATEERAYESFLPEHGYASATPVCDGMRVYSYFGASGMVAYSLDGAELWKVGLGTETSGFGSGGSPIVFENLVIVNASVESESLVALNAETSEQVWKVEGVKRSWGTPVIVTAADGSQELVIYYEDFLKGFNPRTGEELWSFTGVADYVCPSVVAEGDVIYAVGGRRGNTFAVRAGGRGDITETHKLWEADAQTNVPSPVVVGDYLMFVNQQGRAACINRHTGEVLPEVRIEGSANVYASLLSVGDRLYLVSRRNGTYVLSATPEMTVLALNQIASDESDFNASPVVEGNMLYLRSNRFVYCVGD